MKITLNADENLIKRAQQIAKLRGMKLNDAFREWLVQFTSGSAQEVDLLMQRLRHIKVGRQLTRDHMNERYSLLSASP